MKTYIKFSLILLLLSSDLIAQIYTPNGTIQGSSSNNNIGIGVINPGAKLEVNGVTAIGNTYLNILSIKFGEDRPSYFYIDTKIPFKDTYAPQIYLTGYNYGHSNKSVKLTLSWYVYNNVFHWSQYKSDIGYYNPSKIRLGTYNDAGVKRIRIEIANDGIYWTGFYLSAFDKNGDASYYNNWTFNSGAMPSESGDITNVTEFPGVIYNNAGNLLIGKNTQLNSSFKLDVAGTIRANEIVVNTTGADFVFAPEYKLLTLSELETFIKTNQHLPGIAPAKEMQENGISAGEMQTKLLQKVEELTLYVIEKDKEIAAMKTEYDNSINQLKQELENLKNNRL